MLSTYAYTRLTLALDIVRKITSGDFAGYHELGIVKQLISLKDVVTVGNAPQMGMKCNNPMVPLDHNNICWKAVDAVKAEYGIAQNVLVDIEKSIPVQGGLAGGSTNAAAVINLLDELWGLGMTYDVKVRLGRQLGMDVPFYFSGNCAFDSEATGVLAPIKHSLKFYFLLVIPSFGVSTKDAYGSIDYTLVGLSKGKTIKLVEALNCGDYSAVVDAVHNDFELSVFKSHPALLDIRNQLIANYAEAVMMSGSGSTMVGVYTSKDKVCEAAERIAGALVVESL